MQQEKVAYNNAITISFQDGGFSLDN